ncbi:MAG: hypothetical protein ACK5MR_07365 [Cumulibacter sp.]
MFALTIDQRSSRARPDRVPELLALLARLDVTLPFERTAGDEVQGLIAHPDGVIEAIEYAMRSGEWSVGLGVGSIESPLPSSVREARGVALLHAREAVEAAKKSATVHIAVRGGGEDLEAYLRLIGAVLRRRTAAQWRVIDAVAEAGSRATAATRLRITTQAVSKSLLASGNDVVRDSYPLLARLLREADERSQT